MNDYHALAKTYFQQVEGWHLYRSQGDRRLWVWAVFVLIGVGLVWPLSQAIRGTRWIEYGAWLTAILGMELAVIKTSGDILKAKTAALRQEVARQHGVALDTELECRAFLLSKVLERPSDKFIVVAKEISDLMALRDEFRGRNESDSNPFWKAVYDRDSKPRLIALTLGAITLLTALTIRAVPDGPLLFEVINDQRTLSSIGTLVMLSAGLFVLLVFARSVLKSLWHAAAIWWTKSVSSKESRTALRYLARDLVLLHKPSRAKMVDENIELARVLPQTSPPTEAHRRARAVAPKIGVKAAVGSLMLAALFAKSWSSRSDR